MTEQVFRNIVMICAHATGGNPAFDPACDMEALNAIRLELGLPAIESPARMEAILDESADIVNGEDA